MEFEISDNHRDRGGSVGSVSDIEYSKEYLIYRAIYKRQWRYIRMQEL